MSRRVSTLLLIAGFHFFFLPCPSYAQKSAEMVLIPAGEFTMGSDEHFGEGPAHKVYIKAFYIDKYEITNQQYCQFLNEMGNQSENGAPWLSLKDSRIEHTNGCFMPTAGFENHPAVQVTWYGAKAYASWRGCRLPTEAEWEKAARGGFEGRTYSWGDEIDPGMANFGQGTENTTPVGSYPSNGYGLNDMIGNVWEWCNDWYHHDYYLMSPYQNPGGPDLGDARIVRGGGWEGPVHVYAKYLRCSYRHFLRPNRTTFYIGFRCAKSLDQ
jgi:formylglycine-generating enzyme required for sulfatase activity